LTKETCTLVYTHEEIEYFYEGEIKLIEKRIQGDVDNFGGQKNTYLYNENGKLDTETIYMGDGIDEKIIYKYDNLGNLIQTKTNNYEEQVEFVDDYLYDKNGNVVEQKHTENGYNFIISSTYDSENNKITQDYSQIGGNAMSTKDRYKYDKYGNIVERRINDESAGVTAKLTNEYANDKEGNWLKMEVFLDSKPYYTVNRVIEYY